MDVHDFHKDFLEEIKATAATEGAGSNAAFVEVASAYLINAEVLSDFTPAFYLERVKTIAEFELMVMYWMSST